MASVASQLIEEVTAHVQSDSLRDAREICADGTSTICPFVSSVTMKKSTICMMWTSILMDMEFSNLYYLFPGYDQ